MSSPRFMTPLPPYFMIKMPKDIQKERMEKEGSLYFPTAFAYMKRGLQFGIIEKIGTGAHDYMPEAEVGDYLLVHHFIEGKKSDKGYNHYLIDEDDDFNYYIVNAVELPGERGMVFGLSKGTTITPSKDYIFLDKKLISSNEIRISGRGIFMPQETKKTRNEWIEHCKNNLTRCRQLARNIPQNEFEYNTFMRNREKREMVEYSMTEIKKLETENITISKFLNKRKYELHTVAYINNDWNEAVERSFGEKINIGDSVYMLNIACNYEIELLNKTYIVADVKYFGGSLNYMRNAIESFNASKSSHNNPSTEKITNRRRNKKTVN